MSGIEIGLKKTCGGSGPPPLLAKRSAGRVLSVLMLLPGLLGCMAARMIYPLLDDGVALGLMIVLFLLPFVIQLILVWRKRSNARSLGIAYASSACALMLVALVLMLNGGMDKSESTFMTAPVIRKTVATDRYGEQQYHLIVSSWRPGRSSEELSVGRGVFQRAAVGRNVAVEVHRGYFGYPWSGKILPE